MRLFGKHSMCLKGYKQTEEHKRKRAIAISRTLKRLKIVPPSRKNIKHTQETKRKMSLAKIGKSRPEKVRKKISLAKKGKKLSIEHRKKMSVAHKGEHFSEERKEKISRSHIGTKKPWAGKYIHKKGSECYNWKGGLSFEPYGIEFNEEKKERVRNKFNRRCFECGFSENELGHKLDIHHIDYNKQNNSEDNLIPLCRSCHAKTGFTRGDWINYFHSKLYDPSIK